MLFITIGFFYQIGLNPVDVGKFLGANIGSAVGINVSIPENPVNKFALQLKEKEDILNAREQDLDVRAQKYVESGRSSQNILIAILGVGVVLLFVLVIVNYYLDYKRKKSEQGKKIR